MIKNSWDLKLLFAVFFILITSLSGCGGNDKSTTTTPTTTPTPVASNTTTPTPSQLTFQKSLLVKKTSDGKAVAVDDGVFKRGEDVILVLLNVGKFKKGQDGKNWLEMEMLVKDPNGKVIVSNPSLLGGKGKAILKNDVADSPNGTVNTSTKLAPGNYQITLTVYDKVSDAKVSETKSFTLK